MVSEAIVAGTPVIASRIAGNVGLLGEDYPGYFKVGDTSELASLMARAENDSEFLAELKSHCERLAHLFSPERELAAWRDVMTECGGGQAKSLFPARIQPAIFSTPSGASDA